jgi:hypothetical protein
MLTTVELRALNDACVVLRAAGFNLLAANVETAAIPGIMISAPMRGSVYDATIELFDIGTTFLASAVAALYLHIIDEDDRSPLTMSHMEQLYRTMTTASHMEQLYRTMTTASSLPHFAPSPDDANTECETCNEIIPFNIN